MIQISQSDVGKRIEVRYTPNDRRIKGVICAITDRAVAILTDRSAKLYIPFSLLKKYQVRIH